MSYDLRKERKTLVENPWYKIHCDDVESQNGSGHMDYYVMDFLHESVAVVVKNRKNELLFVETFRYVVNEKSLELPAGSAELDECLTDAAKRECLEETGYSVVVEGAPYEYFPSNGVSNQKISIFFGKVDKSIPVTCFDLEEILAVRWLSIAEVKENKLSD